MTGAASGCSGSLPVNLLVRLSTIDDQPSAWCPSLAGRSLCAGFRCASDALMIRSMIRCIPAIVRNVRLVGSIRRTVSPSDVPLSERAAAPPAEQSVVDTAPEPPALRTETVELRRHDTLADLLMRSAPVCGRGACARDEPARGRREPAPHPRGRICRRHRGRPLRNARAVAMSTSTSDGQSRLTLRSKDRSPWE